MSLLVPPRRPSAEALDDADLPSAEMVRSLADLATVHRLWGSSRALAARLADRIASSRTAVPTILDVGAGAADLSLRLAQRLAERGVRARVIALDLQWRHLAAGRARAGEEFPPAAAADAFHLPLASRSVDWAVSTLLFHHFSPEENLRFLRELARISRRGFLVLDLRRHRVLLAAVSLLGRIAFKTRVSLTDGMASVRQAYTPEEASAVAREAVPGASVERVFPYRLIVRSDPP